MGIKAPSWGPRLVRSPFPSSFLPCLQASVRNCLSIIPDIRSKWDTPELLPEPCCWSSTINHLTRQWSNQANADSGGTAVGPCACTYNVQFLLKYATQHWQWHTREDISAPCSDYFEEENRSLAVCACAEAAARDRLVEIYITKHPQVHREISKIQVEAGIIKEWFQDVRAGERKEGEGGGGLVEPESLYCLYCTEWKHDLEKKGILPFKDERVATLKVIRLISGIHTLPQV